MVSSGAVTFWNLTFSAETFVAERVMCVSKKYLSIDLSFSVVFLVFEIFLGRRSMLRHFNQNIRITGGTKRKLTLWSRMRVRLTAVSYSQWTASFCHESDKFYLFSPWHYFVLQPSVVTVCCVRAGSRGRGRGAGPILESPKVTLNTPPVWRILACMWLMFYLLLLWSPTLTVSCFHYQ